MENKLIEIDFSNCKYIGSVHKEIKELQKRKEAEEKAYRTESGSVCAGNGSGVRRFDRCL
jgi:hypothetical protein